MRHSDNFDFILFYYYFFAIKNSTNWIHSFNILAYYCVYVYGLSVYVCVFACMFYRRTLVSIKYFTLVDQQQQRTSIRKRKNKTNSPRILLRS